MVLKTEEEREEIERQLKRLRDEEQELLREQARGFLADNCSYKVPRAIDVMDALPRTGSGKIAKRLLRDGD